MHDQNSDALVALSGGVDSSFALSLAIGRYRNVRAGYVDTDGRGIPASAEEVADFLGVQLIRLDASERFKTDVIEWSQDMLSIGLTPNPCARCNARIKLGMLHEILKPSEVLITGHYSRKQGDHVMRGADSSKDQSYFLSMVDSRIISRCVFPLGDMTKAQVQSEAITGGLPFRKDESMDLCFELLADREEPGEILNTSGEVIGTHQGIANYTIGQRKGFGAFGRKMYVVSIDSASGVVTVGDREDLLSSGCTVGSINWFNKPSEFCIEARVQIRYRRRTAAADLEILNDSIHVKFKEPEDAVAPGQVCAVYLDTAVIGGGIITAAERLERKL
ncbi:MAG: tRNA-specific 2-thiouridylase [Candidatus Aegiribacteria sp.]|nr:tRNA-specific 2-thiouridylase [Candidatus Aegiribacteria sp.]